MTGKILRQIFGLLAHLPRLTVNGTSSLRQPKGRGGRAIPLYEGMIRVARGRPLAILILALATAVCISGQAQAQGQSLGISPAYIEAKVKRGATYNKAFTISNDTPTRLRFRLSVVDYWYNENGEHIDGRPGTLPRSASLWVQFTPTEIVIEPNSSATAKAIISVPQNASGGYYTRPVFEAEAADKSEASRKESTASASVAIQFRGLMMLVTETGAEYNVEVMSGKINPPTQSSALEIYLNVRNRSTAHAQLRGVFAILSPTGVLVGRGRIDPKNYLPGEQDVYKAEWAGELAPGHYTAVVTLSYDRVGNDSAALVYELPFDVK
ncbi:MAG TPA: hypothetical protein VF762_20415 [Blastocatellia bacterium]